MTKRDRAIWIMVGVVAAAFAAAPVVRAQSLSALAGLEKARRAQQERTDPRRGAVIRGQDLTRYEGDPRLPSVTTGQTSTTSTAEDAEADKAYWAAELDAARSAFARAEGLAADANAEVRTAREQPLPETYTEALEASDALQALKDGAAEANSEAQAAREALAAVEAEASRAAAE